MLGLLQKHKSLGLAFVASLLSSPLLIAAEPPAALVSVKQAKQQAITPTVWLSGNVVSRKDARISSEEFGRLTWLLDIGEKVSAGDAIAKLDTSEKALQLAERQAQLRRQQANIEYLKTQRKRLSALHTTNNTARSELDTVERDLTVAQEELVVLELQIRQIDLQLERMTVKAPFAGQVNRRLVQPGEFVTIGTPLVQLVDPVSLDISVATPLQLAEFVEHASEVLVKWDNHLESLPIRTWSPAGDLSTRTFDLRLDASNLGLLAGTGVQVSLPSAREASATMVPRDALVIRDQEAYVIRVGDDNKAQRISVLIGRGAGDWVSVTGLVNPGDQVVVRGGERLRDGQNVRLLERLEATESSNIAAY